MQLVITEAECDHAGCGKADAARYVQVGHAQQSVRVQFKDLGVAIPFRERPGCRIFNTRFAHGPGAVGGNHHVAVAVGTRAGGAVRNGHQHAFIAFQFQAGLGLRPRRVRTVQRNSCGKRVSGGLNRHDNGSGELGHFKIFDNLSVHIHLVTDENGRYRSGVDEDTIRCVGISVAGRILHVEPIGCQCGNDVAQRPDIGAVQRRHKAVALDFRNGHRRADRYGHLAGALARVGRCVIGCHDQNGVNTFRYVVGNQDICGRRFTRGG